MNYKENILTSDTQQKKNWSEGCEANNAFAVRLCMIIILHFAMQNNNRRYANAIGMTNIRILKVGINAAVHFAFNNYSYS